MVTVPETRPPVGEMMLTVGGVVSGGDPPPPLATLTVTIADWVELPAASKAFARKVARPLRSFVVSHEYC